MTGCPSSCSKGLPLPWLLPIGLQMLAVLGNTLTAVYKKPQDKGSTPHF